MGTGLSLQLPLNPNSTPSHNDNNISIPTLLNLIGSENHIESCDIIWEESSIHNLDISFYHMDLIEIDALIKGFKDNLINNNVETKNLASLIEKLIFTLNSLPNQITNPPVAALSLLFVSRLIFMHLIQNVPLNSLSTHFTKLNNVSIVHSLITCLVDTILRVDLIRDSYDLHLELINVILVLISTQLYESLSHHFDKHIFLCKILTLEKSEDLAQVLLLHFIDRVPEDRFIPEFRTTNLMSKVTSSILSLLMIPVQIFNIFFPPSPVIYPLSDLSILLFLILAQQTSIEKNLFMESIKQLSDELNLLFDDQIDVPAHVLTIPFEKLFDSISQSIKNETSLILLYMLMAKNRRFCNFLFSKSDLDVLILPLLEDIYTKSDLNKNSVYITIIILLLFSQDSSFSHNLFVRDIIHKVDWVKESALVDINLGSLMIIILIRVIQLNLSRTRDLYVHSNCIAILVNIAPHAANIHVYAAQKLTQLIILLSKRYLRLAEQPESKLQNSPFNLELSHFSEFIRRILEITVTCVYPASQISANNKQNVHVIYAILQRKNTLLNPFIGHDNFADLIELIKKAVIFFDNAVKQTNSIDLSMNSVIKIISSSLPLWDKQAAHSMPYQANDPIFQYEEQQDSEQFFLPYLWSIFLNEKTNSWKSEEIKIFGEFSEEKHENN